MGSHQVNDRTSCYSSVRLIIHPFQTGKGFNWSVAYVRVHKGVPTVVEARHGTVGSDEDNAQYERLLAEFHQALEACY